MYVFLSARDEPPVANAGEDVLLQLPNDTVTLDGSQSKDDVRIVKYAWRLASVGVPHVKLEDADTPTPTLTNMSAGEYVLFLEVTDGQGQTDEDSVNVFVLGSSIFSTQTAGCMI